MDARERLEKMRNLKEGNLEVKKIGGITRIKKVGGKIELSTKTKAGKFLTTCSMGAVFHPWCPLSTAPQEQGLPSLPAPTRPRRSGGSPRPSPAPARWGARTSSGVI